MDAYLRAVNRGDIDWLRDWYARRLMVDVPDSQLNALILKGRTHSRSIHNGGYLDCWFRCCMLMGTRCMAGQGRDSDDSGPVTAVFHFGFVRLNEDAVMLGRLKHDEETPRPRHLWVAQSKIKRTEQVIQPIDRVAARVVPKE